jgi:hypothetical protein
MNYQEGLKVIENNAHIVGMTSPKGGVIDELILVPTDRTLQNAFYEDYIVTLDGGYASSRFAGADLDVIYIIDKSLINNNGILIHGRLLDLPVQFGLQV